MFVLTLGAHRLPAVEVALIRSLVRLFSHTPSFRWHFVDSGLCDAVIVDQDLPQAELAEAGQRAPAVLKVTRAYVPGEPDMLQRPIRADQLKAWLERQAIELRLTNADRHLPRPAATAGGMTRNLHLRFKLRRWPSAVLLRSDPQRIRLATLLARRALCARELSHISQLSIEQCQDFVDTLRQADLLEVLEVTAPASCPVRPAPSFAYGLIGGIRRRLGL